MAREPKYIVVIGASAGGLNSLIELTAQLTPEMDIAVFAVLHLSHMSMSEVLVERIQKNCAFTCKQPENGETIQSRHFYIAIPDRHLLLKEGTIQLGDGTPENRWRPSIDVLFRSAATAYDGRTIGIILSGLLQDGTSGMIAIQRCGGTTIVQDPAEAEYPDMPKSVMDAITVDYCVSLAAMGPLLLEKSKEAPPATHAIPPTLAKEARIVERVITDINAMKELGDPSLYVCPDCSGGLWEIKEGNIIRYRCHTGHTFTQDELLICQSEALEETLWVALRMLEERKNLLEKMAVEEKSKGWLRMASQRSKRAAELQLHIDRLKDILFNTKDEPELIDATL